MSVSVVVGTGFSGALVITTGAGVVERGVTGAMLTGVAKGCVEVVVPPSGAVVVVVDITGLRGFDSSATSAPTSSEVVEIIAVRMAGSAYV